ncbi:MAG: C39 family peptidase [Polyangiaceae bacterium]
MRRRSLLLGLGSSSLLAACGDPRVVARSTEAAAAPVRVPPPRAAESVLLQNVPHVVQRPDFCGEACIEMAARGLGRTYDQDAVFAVAGIDPALGRGAVTRELATAARALGFDVGAVWSRVDPSAAGAELAAAFHRVLADLHAGVPTIVCMHFDDSPRTTEHFRLIVGYDKDTDEVVYHEPAVADGAHRRMSRARLVSLWPLQYEASSWTLVSLPLRPAALVDPPKASGAISPAAYAQHVIALRERLSSLGLGAVSVRIEEPFVVVGDDTPETLRERAKTVRWAADMLEQDFFARRPRKILDVYLFRNEASYEHGVRQLTGEAPGTPYGFYSSERGGLFMNISTGGGTLVHEIVHPYVEADFDGAAPAWLNEGLGSLFEQSGERAGHIIGYPNWRLPVLQRALRRGNLPTFRELTSMSDHTFYERDRGTNYAQARYLMYYLQETGRLPAYYKAFRAAKATDPTGYATLVAALGAADMAAFQRQWSEFVLALRFER